MTKVDVLNGAKGKPVPFDGPDGFKCLLHPLTWGERTELLEWYKASGANEGSALDLQTKLITLTVCDESGAKLLAPEDLKGMTLEVADAIAREVSRRNGLDGNAQRGTQSSANA